MKEFRNGKTLFLLVFMIIAFSAQESQLFFQLLYSNSQFSLSNDNFTPLQKNILSPINTSRTNTIPHLRHTHSPRNSINTIIDEQDQYFPGSDIHIRNQFEIPQSSGYYVVEQVVVVLLFKEGVDEDTMTAEGDINMSSDHYVHNATTNGEPEGAASLSTNTDHGWVDTTFTIPTIEELNGIGIQSNDTVTIFQYYPAQNTSESKLGKDFNITRTDTFKLSSVASLTSDDFTNDASNDETFRQGENATTVLTAASGGIGIDNVTVTVSGLHFKSNDSEITNPALLGIQFELRDAVYGTPNDTTNVDGLLKLVVITSDSTPEEEYYFNVTADFSATEFLTENFETTTSTTANFTVQNEWDYVDFIELQAVPPSLDPPEHNTTIVTVRVRAQYAYDTQPYYYLTDLPVTATLISYPAGVTLTIMPGFVAASGSPGYFLTNSSGHIAYNITAEYPILYSDIVSNIEFTANLTSLAAPIYPYTSGSYHSPHRFLRGIGETLYISTDEDVSINPDFWVGDIRYFDTNVTSIRPGESALVKYEVFSTQTTDTFVDVPVKIELANPIPGVTLHFDFNPSAYGSYYLTDISGIIYVKVTSTYLVTTEYIQSVPLDITLDFENDSNLRWIGNSNAIINWGWADTLQNFNKTWRVRQLTDITINPDFNNCTISYSNTNESGDTVIRPGDSLLVYFAVRDEGSFLLNNVPANVSFADYSTMKSYGVSLVINPSLSPTPGLPGYYNTSGGYISVIISTEYGVTPKNLNINLKATSDFEHDSLNKWYVGSKGNMPEFRSNSSYSEGSRSITVAPQYFTGYVYIPTDNPPNATLVQHNEILETEFRLRLTYSGGVVYPSIDGLTISIQVNNTDPINWNMQVTPAISQDSAGSSVIFYIRMNATGTTPEAMYTLSVTADFGSIKDRTYNFTSPYPSTVPSPGTLSGVWVNGTDTTGNYSYVSTMFEVKNIDLIRVWIPGGGVTDPFHPDAGFNSATGLFEVYRSTSLITIEGTYKDNTQDPVQNKRIELYLNHSSGTRIPLDTNVWTDTQGAFSAVIRVPNTTPLEDSIKIYGEDPNPPTPREDHEGFDDIRVLTNIQFHAHDVNILNGSTVFLGESVTLTGRLHDNLDQPIDSSLAIFTNSFFELTNNLRVVGWNGTHEIGIAQVTSPYADGTYDITYQIPYNYNQDTLSIRLNITSSGLEHYRVNYTQTLINIYWDFQIANFEIYFPSNDTSVGLTEGATYSVYGENNKDIVIRGTLTDSSDRGLGEKWINTTWNSEISPPPQPVLDDPAGSFTLDYLFTGYENGTWVWKFYHILDNGTELSKYYNVTLNWVVFDITGPRIEVTSPVGTLLPPTETVIIIATITEPTLEVVSSALDNSSVTIQIDGVNDTMSQVVGQFIFSYNWDTLSAIDTIYTITIFASDTENNWNTTSFDIVIDVVSPTGTIDVSENNDGYLEVNSDGVVSISGTFGDNSSITGSNSGVDEASVHLFILTPSDEAILSENISTIIVTTDSFSYDWTIILDPDDLENIRRDSSFSGFEDWTINVTFHDIAGNLGYVTKSVKLDKTPPSLEIIDEIPEEVDEELTITVSYEELETGIYIETLTFEIINSTEEGLSATIRYGDAGYDITETGSQVTLILDTSEFPNGAYTIRIQIRDNTGNLGEIISTSFTINHPSPPNPFTNIILLLVSPLLAFGGGVGLAALYERIRGLRGA
ncbi:MAG: hypothetical protein ACFFDC_09935 [Promethearchaeota archaeon]